MAKKLEEIQQPSPDRKRGGILPPIPGKLISASEVEDLEFGTGGKQSPYDVLLKQLADVSDSSVLKFDSPRCKTSIYSRAKNLGYKVLFAERDGALYVKFCGLATAKAKPAKKPSDTMTVSEAIRQVVREAPRTNSEVADHVQQMIPTADRASISTILGQLPQKGEIAKRDDLKWYPVGVGVRRAS